MLCGYLQFFFVVLLWMIFVLLFNCYGSGEIYGFYVDGVVCQNGEVGWMCIDLLVMLFFCDLESYEGGELVIEDIYG